ncbi:hypothetical protein HN681_04515 [archaeon]|nr:hypothetical protein [archaeon]MBT3731203.1 hypothetical protein [archaeon]MBT4670043.1 hypothetical protein [archaeon]MBT5287754.1 hypothetical protein [archaeon]MBT7052530.1 hypothetical protein [archaeon]
MTKYKVMGETKIKSKGIFNVEDLYVELYLWFKHYGYVWSEIEYRKIMFPGGGYRLEIVWMGKKNLNDYNTFQIHLILGADVKGDVEVQLEGGKKVKRQQATLEFKSWGDLYTNDKIWKGRTFGKQMQKVYEIMTKDRLEQYKEDTYIEISKLYDELKAFLIINK